MAAVVFLRPAYLRSGQRAYAGSDVYRQQIYDGRRILIRAPWPLEKRRVLRSRQRRADPPGVANLQ
ncbi:hypothetical protein DNA98_07375 [Meiothermus sp. Pnk-1]|nr:hypothetical protein DNA98_07375 [Meiothermus sp. Pnk-1]